MAPVFVKMVSLWITDNHLNLQHANSAAVLVLHVKTTRGARHASQGLNLVIRYVCSVKAMNTYKVTYALTVALTVLLAIQDQTSVQLAPMALNFNLMEHVLYVLMVSFSIKKADRVSAAINHVRLAKVLISAVHVLKVCHWEKLFV